MQAQMLAPAAVLVAWTLVVQFWMVFTGFPALKAANIDVKIVPPGGRGQDLEGRLPAKVMWKSHNYTHLMEQPTIFCAAVAILAIAGADRLDVLLAWAYVAIRVVHSLWQSTVNRIPVRVTLFATSSLFLIALSIKALLATVFAGA
ncbi:MAPEG family protein [Altererythrobacter salegens]|uniref:MAPEG family protein n=1 Tax=Croceibacterium salegens TaxID=1737568 RepID=A0A6I4SU44_9SPHN|nr:MAPEG family protein [Croceibacterium salegens]MXO58396.1 MAPEG family protein [Croceibacterium salegens]